MSCVYTWARIHVVEYGFIAPANLYYVGTAIIARWNTAGQQWVETKDQMEQATHHLFCNPHCWMREDLGVIVVPLSQCEGYLELPPPILPAIFTPGDFLNMDTDIVDDIEQDD